jgi:predicted porin
MQYLQLPIAELEEQRHRLLLACSDSHKSTEISYMKKTLLAAALLAGFATAGVAQAETSVTLYGVVDSGYGYTNFKRDTAAGQYTRHGSGMRDGVVGGDRFGLRGSEDLGDGLRAIFALEQGYNLSNGTASNPNNQFNRQAFGGLSSDSWGTFTFGRQYGITSANGDVFRGPDGWGLGDLEQTFANVSAGDRIDNSFKYVTPSFSGFKVAALYATKGVNVDRYETSAGTTDINSRGSRAQIGFAYDNGPIAVGAAYDRESVADQSAATTWIIDGSYDFEVVKVALAYSHDTHGKAAGATGWAAKGGGAFTGYTGQGATSANFGVLGEDFKANNYAVGLYVPAAGGTVYAGWTHSTSNLDDTNQWGSDAGNIDIYHLGYKYPLSKRTAVYAYGSYGKNIGYVDGLKGTEAGLGLNHTF